MSVSTPGVTHHRASLDSRDNGSVIPDSPVYGRTSRHTSGAASPPPRERSFLHSVSAYLMKQSYIAMLIVMMVMHAFSCPCNCLSTCGVNVNSKFLSHVISKLLVHCVKREKKGCQIVVQTLKVHADLAGSLVASFRPPG